MLPMRTFYLQLADRSNLRHNLYNICSGESVLTRDIVQKLAAEFGAPDIKIEIDPNRVRANDIMDIYGSSKKLREDTGWKPTISVDQMIHDYAEWKKAN
jgi:GDP-4-dehydro-6-deoxy-D-mannose reductase